MNMKRVKIVLAPMTNTLSDADGTVSQAEIDWLVSRAKSGFDMIITAASHVSANGQGWIGQLACWDDRFVPGLTRLAGAIRQAGSLPVLQIFHAGYLACRETVSSPVSPSDFFEGNTQLARGLQTDEVLKIIDDFAAAALRAEQSGFAGVEIHGANGYLITQFLGHRLNKRTDAWGGSVSARRNFLLQIIAAIRSRVSSDFIVGVRLLAQDSPSRPCGIELEESLGLFALLQPSEVSYLHISTQDLFVRIGDQSLIEKVKLANPQVPLMMAGGIWTQADVQRAENLGCQFVAVGKAALINPLWPQLVYRQGLEPIRPPVSREYMKSCQLGEKFVSYLAKFPSMISDRDIPNPMRNQS